MVFKLWYTNMPKVKMLSKILQNLRLDSYSRLFEQHNLFKKSSPKLFLLVRLKRRSKLYEICEDLVEAFAEILLVSSIKYLPVLPKNFAENFLSDILLLIHMTWIESNNFCERFHQCTEFAPLIFLIFINKRL